MNFIPQTPSLQHAVLVQIVAALWNQRDIFAQISPLCTLHYDVADSILETKKWKAIEKQVRSNVLALPATPKLFKQLLLHLVKPLGTEIVDWFLYHKREGIPVAVLGEAQRLIWTTHGAVDYPKTAELMAKNQRLDVESRYAIACIDCSEEAARQLFRSMSEGQRHKYVTGENLCLRFVEWIVYFTCTLNGTEDQLNEFFKRFRWRGESVHKRLFTTVLLHAHRAKFEYLFKKLNQSEKVQVLREFETHSHEESKLTRNLMYYFSQPNEDPERRNALLRKYLVQAFKGLLLRHMQSEFSETFDRVKGPLYRDIIWQSAVGNAVQLE